jgi:hypothetical protein
VRDSTSAFNILKLKLAKPELLLRGQADYYKKKMMMMMPPRRCDKTIKTQIVLISFLRQYSLRFLNFYTY